MLIAWLLLSVLVGFIGAGRNIGFFGALILSLILSPLIGGIITLASTSKATATMASEAKKQTVALQNLQGMEGDLGFIRPWFSKRAGKPPCFLRSPHSYHS